MSRKQTRGRPLNVRGDLVGDEEAAERLDVDDDRRTALATMGFGGVLLLLAVVVLAQAVSLDNGGRAVGPASAPWVVGSLLLVVGVLTVLRGRRDMGVWEYAPHTAGPDWRRLGLLVAALLVFAVVAPYLGYVLSATLLFAVTALVLGAPDRPKALALGFITAAVVFLGFDVGIGISLPAGPWGF